MVETTAKPIPKERAKEVAWIAVLAAIVFAASFIICAILGLTARFVSGLHNLPHVWISPYIGTAAGLFSAIILVVVVGYLSEESWDKDFWWHAIVAFLVVLLTAGGGAGLGFHLVTGV